MKFSKRVWNILQTYCYLIIIRVYFSTGMLMKHSIVYALKDMLCKTLKYF